MWLLRKIRKLEAVRKKCTHKVMTKGTKTKYEWMKETCWTLKASKGFIGHFENPDKCSKMKVVEQRTLAWYSKTRCAYDN